jgi:hypothetical protein
VGEVDPEAVAELRVAWNSPQTAELLAGPSRAVVLRSLWAVKEAARTLPNDKKLLALVEVADEQSHAAAGQARDALAKNPADQAALLAVLYAVLASPDDAQYIASIAPRFAEQPGEDAALSNLRLVGRVLVGKPVAADRAALSDIGRRAIAGPDQVALTALACRKMGGPTWNTFRAHAHDLLGSQDLPGEVVVLIHRLEQPQIAIARSAMP